MKTIINLQRLFLMAVPFVFSSCATIVGGSSYFAKVVVKDQPDVKIEYKGNYEGTGTAMIKVKRKEANQFAVTLKKDGCEAQTKSYTSRAFRGWAFAGTLVGWTGVIPGTLVPLPWGIAVDASTGAWWKPNVAEKGISKIDYKYFQYQVDYTGCGTQKHMTDAITK